MCGFSRIEEEKSLRFLVSMSIYSLNLTCSATQQASGETCRSPQGRRRNETVAYPLPVCFFNSVRTLFAVTTGDRSYSSVNSTCTSKSTNLRTEYSRHANAK